MHTGRSILKLVIVAGTVSMAAAQAHAFVSSRHHGPRPQHHKRGYVTLVGDRGSGLGFYDLPPQFRDHPPIRDRRGDAIRYAVATEMGTAYDGYCCGGFREGHHHTMFNPIDGVGTPFFAGYYGPAGDPDADRGPFGAAY